MNDVLSSDPELDRLQDLAIGISNDLPRNFVRAGTPLKLSKLQQVLCNTYCASYQKLLCKGKRCYIVSV